MPKKKKREKKMAIVEKNMSTFYSEINLEFVVNNGADRFQFLLHP
jgi:hypothetical protein